MTPYLYFMKDNRERVKAEHNGQLPFGEIGRLVGKMWEALPDEAKRARFHILFVCFLISRVARCT